MIAQSSAAAQGEVDLFASRVTALKPVKDVASASNLTTEQLDQLSAATDKISADLPQVSAQLLAVCSDSRQ